MFWYSLIIFKKGWNPLFSVKALWKRKKLIIISKQTCVRLNKFNFLKHVNMCNIITKQVENLTIQLIIDTS